MNQKNMAVREITFFRNKNVAENMEKTTYQFSATNTCQNSNDSRIR